MSINTELMDAFPDDISNDITTKSDLHGEDSVRVQAFLTNGISVEGNFAKHPRASFGGVQFHNHKDIVGLMTSKIDAVLRGRAEW